MGVTNDVANYFKRSFKGSRSYGKSCYVLKLTNDPIIERTLTPLLCFNCAEYLAYKQNMHVLVTIQILLPIVKRYVNSLQVKEKFLDVKVIQITYILT